MDEETFGGLIATLTGGLTRAEATVRTVPIARWDDAVQTGDGAWTRRQVLAHMAANDLRQLVRVRVGAGIPKPGDPDALAAEQRLNEWNQARVDERRDRSVEELIAEMHANRNDLIALLRGLSPEQRARPIPFRGQPTPLAEMVPALTGHIDQHAAEIAT